MVDPSTSRLFYEVLPAAGGVRVHSPSPLRDLGTASDLATLQTFTGGHEFDAAIGATLAHYEAMLVTETVDSEPELGDALLPWSYLDPASLGEPSSIAHSAFLLLGILQWEAYPDEARKERLLAELARGIVGQQHPDGTYGVYFSPPGMPDSGWTLYGGEAMLALLHAYRRLGDERLWQSVSMALPAYQARWRAHRVSQDETVFFANWQSQAGRMLAQLASESEQSAATAAYLNSLQDSIEGHRFYSDVEKKPRRQAVVEVACGLEALADALALAVDAGDSKRAARYGEHVAQLVSFLDAAQVVPSEGVPPEAVGGWGHRLHLSTQRIDVTGHVVMAYVKLLSLMGEE